MTLVGVPGLVTAKHANLREWFLNGVRCADLKTFSRMKMKSYSRAETQGRRGFPEGSSLALLVIRYRRTLTSAEAPYHALYETR